MNMNNLQGGALGVCMCSLQVARECGELLPAKTTYRRVVHVNKYLYLNGFGFSDRVGFMHHGGWGRDRGSAMRSRILPLALHPPAPGPVGFRNPGGIWYPLVI